MKFRIRHSIAGRIRLKITPFGSLPDVAARLSGINGIQYTRTNPACGALVIGYDPDQISRQSLLDAVAGSGGPETEADPNVCRMPPATEAAPILFGKNRHFIHFIGLSGIMAAVFVKTVLLKGIVAQTVFSPLGFISLFSAIPLVRDALRDAREKRFTLEGFLAAGCTAATFSGKAVTALEILWIHNGAESLNAWIAERSRRSVSDILDLTAKNTFILAGNVEVEIPVAGVRPRDIVVLHTGEKICVDGEVMSGEAMVDDSPITGRSEPAAVKAGDTVLAGSYVCHGIIYVRASCVGDHTYLARIMRKVEDTLENRAPVESVADRLASNLVRMGLVATLGTAIITRDLWRAFTVMLVMACPCATTLSAKTAVSAAMSAAAKRGILIKGGRYLEEVGTADILCFDKTGTLTTTEPRIETIFNLSDLAEDELLLWAYSAEMHNHHPLALAIRKEAVARGIDPVSHGQCDFIIGRGVRAVFGEDTIRLGNRQFMLDSGISAGPELRKKATALRNKGLTVIFLARNQTLLAIFGFANEARPDARATLDALRGSGVGHIALITGDSEKTALNFCGEMGISDCHHSILPEEKGVIVAGLKKPGSRVVMVGDGINDALALAEADIGIAMSAAGSDIAIEAADIALVKNDLADILYLRALSKKTISIANQNFWLATTTNIGGALAGAMGMLSPVAAGLLHIAHTLGVVANSSRLLLQAGSASDKKPGV